jgi:hypothetical protein
MTNLKIEQNVPIPSRNAGKRRGRSMSEESKLALSMKCGDSIYVEDTKVFMRIKKAMQTADMGIATRTEGEGHRIWRVNKLSLNKKPGFRGSEGAMRASA